MVICATLRARFDRRACRTIGNARGYSVCATLQGGASQGGAQVFAPLRHLRHPFIGWPRWSGAHPPWITPQKLFELGGAR
jgi:hypothetical protein